MPALRLAMVIVETPPLVTISPDSSMPLPRIEMSCPTDWGFFDRMTTARPTRPLMTSRTRSRWRRRRSRQRGPLPRWKRPTTQPTRRPRHTRGYGCGRGRRRSGRSTTRRQHRHREAGGGDPLHLDVIGICEPPLPGNRRRHDHDPWEERSARAAGLSLLDTPSVPEEQSRQPASTHAPRLPLRF